MSATAGHFVLASWVLAAVLLAFTLVLAVAIVTSWLSTRRQPVGVIEATRALQAAGVISVDERRDLISRYEGEPV